MPETNDTPSITFSPYQQPALESGNYTVNTTQTVTLNGIDEAVYTAQQSFYVAGKRYSLDDKDVNSVFPPLGSSGQYSSVLPHIVLNAASLPWQRSAGVTGYTPATNNALPWLALLLFDESEGIGPAQQVSLGDLRINNNTFFPTRTAEAQEEDAMPVSVIDVPMNLFLATVPAYTEIEWLAHVRGVDVTSKPDDNEVSPNDTLSVVVCNRLPQSGKLSTMHLVSLEGYGPYLPDHNGLVITQFPAGISTVRLVSLYSWSFRTAQDQETLAALLTNVNMEPAALQMPFNFNQDGDQTAKQNVLQAFGLGYTALNHQLRNGDRTVSWYRGPLLPVGTPQFLSPPYSNADSLMRYDPQTGMYDVSYASAWQLGKLMALHDNAYAQTLVRWKASQTRAAVNALEEQIINAQVGVGEPQLKAAVSPKQARMDAALKNFVSPAVANMQNPANS